MSKSAYRMQRRRRARREAWCVLDIETRSHFHVGDSHVGQLDQLMTYAVLAGLEDVVIINMGDHLYPSMRKQ